MADLNANKIARQLDETGLRMLRLIIENFSSVLEFSEKWVRAACDEEDILLCEERLARFANFGLIEPDTGKSSEDEEGFFCLRNVELAKDVLNQAVVRAAK